MVASVIRLRLRVPGGREMQRIERLLLVATCCILWPAAASSRAEEVGKQLAFYRGVNLNGPALTIDGHPWEGQSSKFIDCSDARFESQNVPLVPATDEPRAQMIRSSTWSPQGRNRTGLVSVEPGKYAVFLYVWEDNDSQTYDLLVNDTVVGKKIVSGSAGHWQKLGPFEAQPRDGTIVVASSGGHANFSGVELWRYGPRPSPQPSVDPAVAKAFDDNVAPVIARRCIDCHNSIDRKGSLDLSNYAAAIAGGDSGAVIQPGKPEDSLLWQRIEAAEMPPEHPLSSTEADVLRNWIASGAQWGTARIDPFRYSTEVRAGYDWWSLQPLTRPEPPAVKNGSWPRGAIDRFVLARLEEAGLEPSAQANRVTLIRRVFFDVIGLPPTPEEVAAFLDDPAPDAYAKLVDRLLDSPRYGERWARHWLDVIRFGESQGFERNKMRPNAWKYRDWVIEALNSDLAYDEFVRLQLAGDVLRPDDPLAVIASGFLVAGPYDLTAYTDGTAPMKAFAREEEMEGLVGTVGQTFLGLTINCARCHDHKFDPVSQKEYYQIATTLAGTQHGDERETLADAATATVAEQVKALESEIAGLRSQAEKAGASDKALVELKISRLQSRVALLKGGPAHLTVPKHPGVLRVLARGDFKEPRDPVTPAGIVAVAGTPVAWQIDADAPEGERRKALAAWITHPGNPLTARVIANRIWSYYFGAGLVSAPSDFGFNGGRPSHPELLDWLASELKAPQEGSGEPATSPAKPWSMKHLHRLILLSATYQQSSKRRPNALQVDAENRLLWRHNPKRLEAEALRDAVLTISGQLNPAMGGPGFRDFTTRASSQNQIYEVFDAVGPEFNRRSIYRTWVRTGTNPFLDVLDCPDPSVATPRRSVTTTPLQALSLLNNAFMERSASAWAERLKRTSEDVTARVERAYREAFARPPTEQEQSVATPFMAEHGLAQFCLVLMNTNEFLFID